jgi:hypothetical protein
MKIKGSRLALAACAVAAFGAASAASLGAISSADVGSGDTILAGCDVDGISTTYDTTYDQSTSSYLVTTATISGIAAPCVGQTMHLTIKDADGTSISTGSVVVGAGNTTETITGLAASAEDTASAAVVIA